MIKMNIFKLVKMVALCALLISANNTYAYMMKVGETDYEISRAVGSFEDNETSLTDNVFYGDYGLALEFATLRLGTGIPGGYENEFFVYDAFSGISVSFVPWYPVGSALAEPMRRVVPIWEAPDTRDGSPAYYMIAREVEAPQQATVPEPSSVLLLALGLAGLGASRRKAVH